MHVLDNNPAGFEWVDANDNATSTVSLLRKSESPQDTILAVCNFTPVPRRRPFSLKLTLPPLAALFFKAT
jgi:1,4-alpha-glucan branching enzyme